MAALGWAPRSMASVRFDDRRRLHHGPDLHTNNLPGRGGSQKEALRKRFTGLPEACGQFLLYVAEEFASCSACLGVARLKNRSAATSCLVPRG